MQEIGRKLASVRVISEVSPIEGADKIEKVTIDGWTCVVQKGEFKPGDLCVYFEIDSFLPIRPEFEFLRKSCYKKLADGREGFRLKTIRLRGVVSQGLALPVKLIDSFEEKFRNLNIAKALYRNVAREMTWHTARLYGGPFPETLPSGIQIFEGMNITDELGITKYDPPIPVEMQGKARNFPGFLRKTDQERVQNIWQYVKDLDETFEVTIKLDGMSCTYYYYNGKFGVCSRNVEIEEDENNTLWKIGKKYEIEKLLKELCSKHKGNLALQGEVIGEGIQGNREKLIGQEFYLFDIFDIDKFKYFFAHKRRACYNMFFPPIIKHVPIIESAVYLTSFKSLNELLSYADGPSLNNPVREGIVFKSNNPGSEHRFKVISNEFLLKPDLL